MVLGIDPVRNGFVESLARPGGNITGLTMNPGQSMHGKMLALLNQLLPAASVIGVLGGQGVGTDRRRAGRRRRVD
jgi:putative ABC transport system substrate-binding protein